MRTSEPKVYWRIRIRGLRAALWNCMSSDGYAVDLYSEEERSQARHESRQVAHSVLANAFSKYIQPPEMEWRIVKVTVRKRPKKKLVGWRVRLGDGTIVSAKSDSYGPTGIVFALQEQAKACAVNMSEYAGGATAEEYWR